jgi:hypothetical protein
MAEWIPSLVAKVAADSQTPEVIGWVCRRLEDWLIRERQWVARQQGDESKK